MFSKIINKMNNPHLKKLATEAHSHAKKGLDKHIEDTIKKNAMENEDSSVEVTPKENK